jgi:hypothetical protein
MPRRRLIGVALAVAVIGAAAYPRLERPAGHVDSAAAAAARTPAPAPVMTVLRRACFDCHSEETRWPWYARLPIASHLIERDVSDGRGQLNWSQWERYNAFDRAGMLDNVCDLATMRRMPPWQYRWLHPEARLTTAEIDSLCTWARQEAERLTQGGS